MTAEARVQPTFEQMHEAYLKGDEINAILFIRFLLTERADHCSILASRDETIRQMVAVLREVRAGEDDDFEREWARPIPPTGCDCALCDDIRAALRLVAQPAAGEKT